MEKFILSAFADEAAPDLKGQIAALKNSGISGLEIRNIDGGSVINFTAAQLKEIKNTLDGEGIKVTSIGSPIGKVEIAAASGEPERLKKAIESAHVFGTDKIRMFSIFMKEKDTEANEAAVFDVLGKMIAVAEKENIKLCLENEKGIYGDKYIRVSRLIKEFGSRLRHVFDGANYILSGDDPMENYAAMKNNIEYFHIKDARKSNHAIVPAGYGDSGYETILSDALKQNNGKPVYLTLEPHLVAFSGLNHLQSETLNHEFSFASEPEAFAFGAGALKKIIENITNKA